jgi:fibronectin type 3 domain-containing protein
MRTAVEKRFLERDLVLSFDRPVDLLPPERLRAVDTQERRISLTWEPVLVGDVAGYAVLRSPDAEGPFERAGRTVSRFGSVFIDEGPSTGSLGDGRTYHYRIHPFDASGRVGRNYSSVQATTEGPPDVPTGLRAYSHRARRVILNWDASPRASATGYAIYRGPSSGGPWTRVGYVSRRFRTVYEDPVLGDLRVMYYRISALNRFEGESARTEPVRAVTKAEPLPPDGLALQDRRLGAISVRWSRNVERDILAYEVWRSRAGRSAVGEEQQIARIDAPQVEFEDGKVGCGEKVRYRVRAVDADGLVSDFSTPLEVVGAALGAGLERSGGTSIVRWDPARAHGWEGVRVYQHRRLLPDVLLGEGPVATAVHLPALKPGTHKLAVVLTRTPQGEPPVPTPETSPPLELSPPCQIQVRVE